MNEMPRIRHLAVSPLPDAEDWAALEEQAAEPAFSSMRAWLMAGMAGLPVKSRPLPVVALDDRGAPVALCGIAQGARWNKEWPQVATPRWTSFFCHGVPLIDGRDPQAAVAALLQTLAEGGTRVAFFPSVTRRGPFMKGLAACATEMGLRLRILDVWQRAALDATLTEETWWRGQIRRRRRKEWQRLKRRLQERGKTSFEILQAEDDPRPWIEDFLTLEASGWKGRAGTALLKERGLAAFTRQALIALHAEGRLRFWRLRHAGRTIASLFAMLHLRTLVLGKIAYDETMAAYSPGVLLTIEATREILADPAVDWADSCAIPGHPMIDHLWKQRLEMADVLITLPGSHAGFATGLALAVEGRYHARRWLKTAWHRWRRILPHR